ncbi:hypothetical protein IWX75_000717 [Arthrobacter sp. CAN_A6]|uniref:DUF6314 family protein n=1 Tax=Arthrobacter sp. CAN_A6 TaxID=2787721 RepID=UPI0018CA9422
MPVETQRCFPVADAAAFLLGTWEAERTLMDNWGGRYGTFTGTTTFTPDDAGCLSWAETGTVSWQDFRGPAFREYLLEAGTVPSSLRVLFPDRRPFHDLDLSTGSCTAEHWCSPDAYRIRFTVRTPDVVEYSWDVQGPAKDQLLTTVLRRRNPPAPPHEL